MQSALQQAKARLQQQEQRVPTVANRDAIQYCWYAPPYNISHRDFGKIQRLRWTPITRQEKWLSIAAKEKPEDFVAVRNVRADMLRIRPVPPPNQGLTWIKPGAIAESLHQEYGDWGLLVSKALRDIRLDEFEALNLDGFYFPMLDERLPDTHKATNERIEKVLNALEKNQVQSLGAALEKTFKAFTTQQQRIVIACGKEMLGALEQAKAFQTAELAQTHKYFEDARAGKSGNRGTYDPRDRAMMAWLEIVPQDEVQNLNAQANTQLIELAKAQLVNGGQSIDYAKLGEGIAAGLISAGLIPKPEKQ